MMTEFPMEMVRMLIDIKIGIIARKYMNICRTLFSVKVKALLAASVLF